MINLKMTKTELEDETAGIGEENPYPWGTRISIDDDNLADLKLDAAIGDSVSITALAKVVAQSEDESEDHEHKSMSFQITDIEVLPITADAADILYPKNTVNG